MGKMDSFESSQNQSDHLKAKGKVRIREMCLGWRIVYCVEYEVRTMCRCKPRSRQVQAKLECSQRMGGVCVVVKPWGRGARQESEVSAPPERRPLLSVTRTVTRRSHALSTVVVTHFETCELPWQADASKT